MGLETFNFIPDLVATNPEPTDPVAQGDDHLRGIKFTLQTQWPNIGDNAVTRTALQMNDAALRSEANTYTATNRYQATSFHEAPIQGFNGSEASPGYAFETDFSTGMWSAGAGLLNFAVGGVDQFNIQASRATFFPPIRGSDGDAALPQYSFVNNANMGMYRIANDLLGLATAGAERLRLEAAQTTIRQKVLNVDGTAAAPSYSFSNDPDIGMFRDVANRISFATAGVLRAIIDATQVQSLGTLNSAGGTAALPAHSFTGDLNKGMYSPNLNELGLSTNSLEAIRIDTIQQATLRKENTVTRLIETQARTGWRYTNNANQPQWAIYLGTSPNNVLSFQRYNSSGTFQDIPFQLDQTRGTVRMPTLPTSAAGLVSGDLYAPAGFVQIVV